MVKAFLVGIWKLISFHAIRTEFTQASNTLRNECLAITDYYVRGYMSFTEYQLAIRKAEGHMLSHTFLHFLFMKIRSVVLRLIGRATTS